MREGIVSFKGLVLVHMFILIIMFTYRSKDSNIIRTQASRVVFLLMERTTDFFYLELMVRNEKYGTFLLTLYYFLYSFLLLWVSK